jgi:hypothetical protein
MLEIAKDDSRQSARFFVQGQPPSAVYRAELDSLLFTLPNDGKLRHAQNDER